MLLYMDGFDGIGTTEGSSITDLLRRNYITVVSGDNFVLRPDSEAADKSLSFGVAASALNSRLAWLFPSDVAGQTIVVGFRFKTRDHTDGTAEHKLLQISSDVPGDTGRHLMVAIDYTNQRFILRRGNTLLDNTSSSLLGLDTWYHVEFKFNIHNSTGLYELRLDGTDVMSDSGVDTKEVVSDFVYSLEFQGIQAKNNDNADEEFLIDDFYVLDSTGANNNDFLGPDVRVVSLLPDAEGTTNDFTPSAGTDNSANVDENPASSADYNAGSTNGDIDEYSVDTLSADSVFGVMTRAHVNTGSGNGVRTYRHRVRSSASVGNGSDFIISDDVENNQIFETDPNTATLWTPAGVNAAEFGVEVRD